MESLNSKSGRILLTFARGEKVRRDTEGVKAGLDQMQTDQLCPGRVNPESRREDCPRRLGPVESGLK